MMNREYVQTDKMPLKLDTFVDTGNKGEERFFVEYDGFDFEGKTMKSVTNKLLNYIFRGGSF